MHRGRPSTIPRLKASERCERTRAMHLICYCWRAHASYHARRTFNHLVTVALFAPRTVFIVLPKVALQSYDEVTAQSPEGGTEALTKVTITIAVVSGIVGIALVSAAIWAARRRRRRRQGQQPCKLDGSMV